MICSIVLFSYISEASLTLLSYITVWLNILHKALWFWLFSECELLEEFWTSWRESPSKPHCCFWYSNGELQKPTEVPFPTLWSFESKTRVTSLNTSPKWRLDWITHFGGLRSPDKGNSCQAKQAQWRPHSSVRVEHWLPTTSWSLVLFLSCSTFPISF